MSVRLLREQRLLAATILAGGLLAAGARADRFGPPQLLTGIVEQPVICTADVDGDGDQDVLVVDNVYDKVSWYENLDGRGAFGGERIIKEPRYWSDAGTVASADLDGDGDPDVLVGGSETIAWYENTNGQGSFCGPRLIGASDERPAAILGGDFDGDGDQDVLFAAREDGEVAWYGNTDGLGNFGPARVITASAENVRSAYAADMDGDGDADVLVASQDDDTLAWYENADGQGNFGPARVISTQGDGARTVFAADLDADGDQDVILGSHFDATVAWYENTDGLGTFGAPRVITSQTNLVECVHAADVDGDGDPDVLTASHQDGTVLWFPNTDGLGTFGPPRTISIQSPWAYQVLTADLDADGDLDVLSTAWFDKTAEWHENTDGLGGFGPPHFLQTTGSLTRKAVAADMDGDGDQDVLAGFFDRLIGWYENLDGRGRFGEQRVITDQISAVQDVLAVDLDGDGDQDVLASTIGNDAVLWFANDGTGTFGPPRTVTTQVASPRRLFAADLDGDGALDVLSASSEDDTRAWYRNTDGSGTFGPQRVITTLATGAHMVVAGDLDGDGDLDVLAAVFEKHRLVWFENLDGDGTFGSGRVITWQVIYPTDAFASDLDGDGDLDVLSTSWGDDKLAWYENLDGLGHFGPQQVISTAAPRMGNVRAADLDGDGDRDVLAADHNRPYERISWFENQDGTGQFGPERIITDTIRGPHSIETCDLDGDDDLDILSASHDWDTNRLEKVAWFENRGDAAAVSARSTSSNPTSHVALDSPVLGGTYHATVDLGATGHAFAWLAGFSRPDYTVLPGRQVLLVNALDPDGELLGLPLQTGPVATFAVPIPNDLSLVTFEIFTQALHAGGGLPFALSNAQDLYLGF